MTIIDRKAFEPGGIAYLLLDGKCEPLPPNVAYIESDYRGRREITWDEVMKARRKEQAGCLEWKLRYEEPRILPCYVWTFFNRQAIPYYGWYCYVVTRHFDIGVNFQGLHADLATSIMTAVPMGMLPLEENFYKWMELFAKNYPRRKHSKDRRKAGSVIGWLQNRTTFTLQRP